MTETNKSESLTFTAVMAVYLNDRENDVDLAVKSILNQSLPPDRFIIVADGPLDAKVSKLLSHYKQNPLIHIVRLDKNYGRGQARNFAIKESKTDLIAMMDADDISRPFRFASQIAVFENEKIDVLGAGIEEFSALPGDLGLRRDLPKDDKTIKASMAYRTPFNHVTVMFRKSLFDKISGYRELNFVEDWDFALRAAGAGAQFMNTEQVLVDVRVSPKSNYGYKYLSEEIRILTDAFQSKTLSGGAFFFSVAIRLMRFLTPAFISNRMKRRYMRNMSSQAAD